MKELTINLNSKSNLPLYEQIYRYIKDEIKAGRIHCRTKLPSTRALASHLQVSRSTIDMAYTQLLSEGYIESVPYKGYYVAEVDLLYTIQNTRVDDKSSAKAQKNAATIDFSPRGIDLSSFPYNTWRKITKNALSSDNKELFKSGEHRGDEEFRKTICNYLYAARGVRCSFENIIIGAGNEYLLMLLNRLIDVHSVIAMENPTYKQAYRVLCSLGNKVIPIGMDKSGMKTDELCASDATIAYVMPSHQYPLGIVMPIKRRLELLQWAAGAESRYLIEDDYDSEFRYIGKPIPALQSIDDKGKVIYIGTFSKSIAPAIRMSYMVLPAPLMELYNKKLSFYSSTVSRIDQTIVNTFISDGYYERHLNKMRAIYRNKHDLLLNELKGLDSRIQISGENAGIHIMLTIDTSYTEQELINRAIKAGARVYGLTEYFIEKPMKAERPTIILGYANLSDFEIIKGVNLLKQAWIE